jgi:hypothetical protein
MNRVPFRSAHGMPVVWRKHVPAGESMIVINRNGQRTVITGWRAWLIAGPVMLLVAVVITAISLMIIGTVLSIATILLFAVPFAIALMLALQLFQSPRS